MKKKQYTEEENARWMAEYNREVLDLIADLDATYMPEVERFDQGMDLIPMHSGIDFDPAMSIMHYMQPRAFQKISPGPGVEVELQPENVDYVPRHEPYSFLGTDLTEPVLVLVEPTEVSRMRQTSELQRGAATALRAMGSVAANAAVVMEPQLLSNTHASVQGIWGRLASAIEMVDAGWRAYPPPRQALDVVHVDMAGWPSIRHAMEGYQSLFVPDDWGEEMMAALVSLMVMGGPGAYRWAPDPDNQPTDRAGVPLDDAAREYLMPAGARVWWPGGHSNRFLLVTTKPREWRVAFGGGALSHGPLMALQHRFLERFGTGCWENAAKLIAATNRVYAPPEYIADEHGNNYTQHARASREMPVLHHGRRSVLPHGPGPGKPRDRPDEWDDSGDAPFARAAVPNEGLARAIATGLAYMVDDREQPNDERPQYQSHLVGPRGLQVNTNFGTRLYPWQWVLGQPAPPGYADWEEHWRRIAAPFLGDRYPEREESENVRVEGRVGRPRDVYGLQDGTCSTRLPNLGWDGWYPVLIGINALARATSTPRKLKAAQLTDFATRMCTDLHLIANRMMYDGGVNPAALGDNQLPFVKVIRALPRAYRIAYIPGGVTDTHMPYGGLECLESSAFLGGDNETPYVGFQVPGSWSFDRDNGKVKFKGEEASAEQRMRERRSVDSAVREIAYHGQPLVLTKPADRRVAVIYSSQHARLPHPFSLPQQVKEHGDTVKIGIRTRDALQRAIFACGSIRGAYSSVAYAT